MNRTSTSLALAAALASTTGVGTMVGCESLPGDRETQATVIGGVAGAAAGALIAENRLMGALIGGLLGAGGGYLIGAHTDWFESDDDRTRTEARRSVEEAQRSPATADQALRATTADINRDGFVTLDEVIAMERAGLSNGEMIRRLEATGHVFDLNADQERVLRDAGVSRQVVDAMRDINRAERDRYLSQAVNNEVISGNR